MLEIMKKFKLFICLLALVSFISSCHDDDDKKSLSFEKSSIEVVVGKTSKTTIKNGDGKYLIKSGDAKIATATISGKEITVAGVKVGTTKIIVSDKSGSMGVLTVSVIADPKTDANTRFVWDKTSKIQGTHKGTYKLSYAANKVEWNFKSEDAKSTIVLTFTNAAGAITEGVKTNAVLTIDGKAVTVTALEVIQNKVVKTGEKATVWIVFNADKKGGVVVGQLSE